MDDMHLIDKLYVSYGQRILTYFERGNITLQLTSCSTNLHLTNHENLLLSHHKQSS